MQETMTETKMTQDLHEKIQNIVSKYIKTAEECFSGLSDKVTSYLGTYSNQGYTSEQLAISYGLNGQGFYGVTNEPKYMVKIREQYPNTSEFAKEQTYTRLMDLSEAYNQANAKERSDLKRIKTSLSYMNDTMYNFSHHTAVTANYTLNSNAIAILKREIEGEIKTYEPQTVLYVHDVVTELLEVLRKAYKGVGSNRIEVYESKTSYCYVYKGYNITIKKPSEGVTSKYEQLEKLYDIIQYTTDMLVENVTAEELDGYFTANNYNGIDVYETKVSKKKLKGINANYYKVMYNKKGKERITVKQSEKNFIFRQGGKERVICTIRLKQK